MKRKRLLLTGVMTAVCLIFTGCARKEPVELEDMAVGISAEAELFGDAATLSEGSRDGVGEEKDNNETTQSAVTSTGQENRQEPRSRETKDVKAYLAQFPNELSELEQLECYISLHGKEYSGREYLDAFMEQVQSEKPAELVLVQFTVEGDAILDYLNYNGEDVYRMQDVSRDGWAGNGEKYFEYTYDSVSVYEEADTEGNLYLHMNVVQEGDMVFELLSTL